MSTYTLVEIKNLIFGVLRNCEKKSGAFFRAHCESFLFGLLTGNQRIASITIYNTLSMHVRCSQHVQTMKSFRNLCFFLWFIFHCIFTVFFFSFFDYHTRLYQCRGSQIGSCIACCVTSRYLLILALKL